MRIRKYYFNVSLGCASEDEEVEIEFEGDETEEEIEETVSAHYDEWMWQHVQTHYNSID